MSTKRPWLRRGVGALLVAGVLYTAATVVIPLFSGPDGAPATPTTPTTPMTPEARQAIDGLRETSVYVRKGGADDQWRLDVAAARELIGDRPLLVAGFADQRAFSPDAAPYASAIADAERESQREHGRSNALGDYDVPMRMTCDAIAAEYRDAMVVVLHPRGESFNHACIGPDFPRYEYDDDPPRWPTGVLASASTASARQVEQGDMLPLIENLVPSYERGIERLEEPPGTRDLGGPFRTLRISGYVVGGVVAAALLFVLLRGRFRAAADTADDGHRTRSGARAAAQADLNALADRVLALERDQASRLVAGGEPPDPEAVLAVAEGYVQLVRDADNARTAEQFDAIARRARALREGC